MGLPGDKADKARGSQPDEATARVQMQVTPDQKRRWVRASKARRLSLRDWIAEHADAAAEREDKP